MDGVDLLKFNGFLWRENESQREQIARLSAELARYQDQARRVAELEQRLEKELSEKALLKARLKDLEERLNKPRAPSFIKPNVPKKRRKRPGREEGHVAALRPMPEKIDRHQDVPLPADAQGKASCPRCNTQLSDLKEHQRVVEEIIPAQPITICYHTTSGYCPC